jgi:hypothetical protein
MNRLDQSRNTHIGYMRGYNYSTNIDEIKGNGIFDPIKKVVRKIGEKTLIKRPKVMNRLLTTRGNRRITHIQVCREPISKALRGLMNILSFGALKRNMDEKGYDKLFHLWLAIHLDNGEVWTLQKNQRVEVDMGRREPNIKRGGECTPLKQVNFNVKNFIEKAENENPDGPNFYRYSPFKYNCQRWVRQILNINGITQYDKFIQQDTAELVPKILRKFGRTVTDIAGVADFITKGGAMT